jgi:hypothetical protein
MDLVLFFFGLSGSLNDTNVLQRSHIFLLVKMLRLATTPSMAHEYNMGYYLADDIYAEWETLVKTIRKSREQSRGRIFKGTSGNPERY